MPHSTLHIHDAPAETSLFSARLPETRRFFALILIFAVVTLLVLVVTLSVLYNASYDQARARVLGMAHSQAGLIEAVAAFDQVYSDKDIAGGADMATLGQVENAVTRFRRQGQSEEIVLARRIEDGIKFLVPAEVAIVTRAKPISFGSPLSIPMQKALQGESGVMTALDYRGRRVLAAYEPIAVLNLGLVVKIELAEIQRPFIMAGLYSLLGALVLIGSGAFAFFLTYRPVLLQLQASERRHRAIVDLAADGIITFGASGKIRTFNRASERLFGYSAAEVAGKDIRHLIPHTFDQIGGFPGQAPANPASLPGEDLVGIRMDGSTFPLEFALSQWQLAGRHIFTGIARDLTELRNAERMKNEFISTVSHELRSPLTSIIGSLGLLRGGVVEPLGEQTLEMVEVAYDSSQRLVRLVNDLLDFQKMEVGHFDFSMAPAKVSDFVHTAVEALKGYAKGFGVQVVVREPLPETMLTVDQGRVIQALTNLVSNAIKFSPEGETVEVEAKHKGEEVMFQVTDHGPGIPASFRGKIFFPFSQANSSDSRQTGGTGLGLAITKAIVERHGGTIGFENGETLGARFYFNLPTGHPPSMP